MESTSANRVKAQVEEVKEAFDQSRQSVRELSQAAVDTSKEVVACTDDWVRSNAWKLLAMTLALGLVAGILFGRRGDSMPLERVPR